jgi:hypothetical protein
MTGLLPRVLSTAHATATFAGEHAEQKPIELAVSAKMFGGLGDQNGRRPGKKWPGREMGSGHNCRVVLERPDLYCPFNQREPAAR